MYLKLYHLGFIMLAAVLSLPAYAFDFSRADALYAQRENNPGAIAEARSIYRSALGGSLATWEKIHVIENLSRLAFYEGELLTPQDDHAKRVPIFTGCMEDVEQVKPSKIGENGAYYYFKSLCLAMWAKSAQRVAVIARVGEFKDVLNMGMQKFPQYANGGIYRIYANTLIAEPLLRGFGLYDVARGLEYAQQAVNIGPEHYNAYMILADALDKNGRRAEGVSLLQHKKEELTDRLEEGRLPVGYEPESKVFLKQIETMLRRY